MEYITRKKLNQYVLEKDKITVDDFVYILEKKLDYDVILKKEIIKRMTDFIFAMNA